MTLDTQAEVINFRYENAAGKRRMEKENDRASTAAKGRKGNR
jgi:hypothetical protein